MGSASAARASRNRSFVGGTGKISLATALVRDVSSRFIETLEIGVFRMTRRAHI
jgi:hypothetical protein